MNYLSLQIDNQWAYLKEGTEIALEGNNPIFSDSGSKTYLFQLHVESNRHLFGNADEIYGESYYKAIDGKRATLYVSGIPVMTGKVSLEDEVYMDEDGCIAINLVSGNLEFAQMIEGMNCRDVELMDEILVGYLCDKFTVVIKQNPDAVYNPDLEWRKELSLDFPYNLVVVENTNITNEYPTSKYCNIRRCYAIDNSQEVSKYIEEYHAPDDFITASDGVLSLEEASLNSGPCFYVLYFIDCLAKKLGLTICQNDLLEIEDAKRLAFVNLSCKVKAGNKRTNRAPSLPSLIQNVSSSKITGSDKLDLFSVERSYYTTFDAFATSENFPDEQVSNIISAICSLFNVKFILNDGYKLSIISTKSIIRDEAVIATNPELHDAVKVENNIQGFMLSYSSTDKEDTNFNFDRYDDIEVIEQYGTALRNVSSFNKKVYIDSRTGNAYAIKVDEDAVKDGAKDELNPILFEVGAFSPAIYGNCSNEERVQHVQLNFTPIINNDINGKSNLEIVKTHPSSPNVDSLLENTYAFLIPEDIEAPNWLSIKFNEAVLDEIKEKHWYSGGEGGGYYVGVPHDFPKFLIEIKYFNILGAISYSTESPVNSYETGLMFGIMRGPGNESNVEYYAKNFDGEGNYRVAFTSANYAFTSDSIDNCNNDFDYNGTGEGGVDYSGRFSLKLRAGKYDKEGNPIKDADGNPIVIQNKERAERGLYDKFWKEYAYFTVNKKIVRLRLRMEVADFITLDWTKRYKIGEYVGFIANWNMSVSDKGISEVEMDMYYI